MGGDKAYELLRQAMINEQAVAIDKTVIGQSEAMGITISGIDFNRGALLSISKFNELTEKRYSKSKVISS